MKKNLRILFVLLIGIAVIVFLSLFIFQEQSASTIVGDHSAGVIFDTTISDFNRSCSESTINLANSLILSDEATASVHNEKAVPECKVDDDWLIINTEDKLNWASIWDGNTLMYYQPVINVDEAVTYCGSYTHVCVNPTFGVSWDIEASKDSVETIRSP